MSDGSDYTAQSCHIALPPNGRGKWHIHSPRHNGTVCGKPYRPARELAEWATSGAELLARHIRILPWSCQSCVRKAIAASDAQREGWFA